MSEIFEARVRRAEAESKFKPKIAPSDKNDPLSGPNDLAVSPLLQDFGQGAVWLSLIMSADAPDLSPRLREVQRALLEDLQQEQVTKPGQVKKEIRKPLRTKDLEKSNTAQDVQRILQAERNFQHVLSQLRVGFPAYAELYLHQSPRRLNPPGESTAFELTDPTISADPLKKNERMQAGLIVKVYRYDEHSFKIVSFWLYREIEDPDIFVPRTLYTEKGRDATRNSEGRWDGTHMPPRTFSSDAYVSQAVTSTMVKFVDGEPVMSGRGAPAGRRRAQPISLATLSLKQLDPAGDGVLDVSVPSFPVTFPDIPTFPALVLQKPQLGRDFMPRIRESYEFRSQAEYEAYLTGIRESLAVLPQQATQVAETRSSAKADTPMASAIPKKELSGVAPKPSTVLTVPVATEHLIPVFLNPQEPTGLNELSLLARDSLKQHSDLQPVATRNLVNQLFEKSNAGLSRQEEAAGILQQRLPKVRELNIYLLASENTTASWRGPDDSTGKGGIVVILPNRYYFDPQQFYRNVASALINQPLTSQEVATLASLLGEAVAQPKTILKQFAIETDYLDHGWDENGDMRKWADEAVDFFKHLGEAITYLKPRLETMPAGKRTVLEQEIPAVEAWLNSLGDASVTVNFGMYKGKNEAPPPKADPDTRTILINCRAEEYVKSEQRENRWALFVKLIEGFNGLKVSGFDPAIAGAIYDILVDYARDKDNKLMIAWRLNTDLPPKPVNWPLLASVARMQQVTMAAGPQQQDLPAVNAAVHTSASTHIDPIANEHTADLVLQPLTAPQSPASPPQSAIATNQAAASVPQLTERPKQPAQPAKAPELRWSDPAFGRQITNLMSSHMNGVGSTTLRGIVLQTMMDRLIIVRDPNPNFHSRISAIEMREPSPDHFDLTVNKTAYFDALFALGEKDKAAHEVIWSTFAANQASIEYAAGNPEFGPYYTALQSDLTALIKRHTNDAVVSPEIFSDPQFKTLLPYYTAFWSNWQFAGERARFQYLHDRVTAKRLRQLAEQAGNRPDTKPIKGDLLQLADEVDLFYGDILQASNLIPAVESDAGRVPNSLDTVSISHVPEHEYNKGTLQPWQMKDYKMTQVISLLQKVEQPAGQHSNYQETFRRGYVIYQLLEAWNRIEPDKRNKLLRGEWAGSDLRFVLAVLAEIHANRLSVQPDSSAALKLSTDMPWLLDPRFDLTQGAFEKFPDTLKPKPSAVGAPPG